MVFQRNYTSCFERAVVGACKQTYIMLYVINCLCLWIGEKFIFLSREFSGLCFKQLWLFDIPRKLSLEIASSSIVFPIKLFLLVF